MLKNYFIEITKNAINKAIEAKDLGQMSAFCNTLVCEKPKNVDFGDFSINVSTLSRDAKMAPPVICQNIARHIKSDKFDVNCVQGFLNFKVKNDILFDILIDILKNGENFARINKEKPNKINLEYVSANPTGPFHIGHGRWAAVGSALSNVLKYAGDEVFQEFYINDAGNQIKKLGISLECRVRELRGENVQMPEDCYPGEYLIDCAKEYIKENSTQDYSEYAKAKMLQLQKELLEKFRTHFDLFFSESTLYQNNEVQKCVDLLQKAGKLYEKDGALWFKTTDFGDEQDRVLKKTDGTNTYLTADIAYHQNKLNRGFDTLINIWGADHHGYIKRMEASIDALGGNSKCLEVLLGQLVNIIQDGEAVRMGKRKKMVTLDELVDEVGVDATRYWMLMRSIDTTLDFDIDLAKSKTDQNPVFYVQYAHARCCSILRHATSVSIDTLNEGKIVPAPIKNEEFQAAISDFSIQNLFDEDKNSANSIKTLILKLEELKSVVQNAANTRAPYLLCKYLQELSACFHHFYNFTRVITSSKSQTLSRMLLVHCTKTTMKIALSLLAISAPEKM